MRLVRCFAPSIVFATFAVLAAAGWEGAPFRVCLLTSAAVAFWVSERAWHG